MAQSMHERRSDELSAAKAIVEGAKEAVRGLTDDEQARVDAHLKNVDDLDVQIKAANEQQARIKRLGALDRPETGDDPDVKQSGDFLDHFIKTAQPQLVGKKGTRFSVSTPEYTFDGSKAATVTTGLSLPQFGDVVPLRLQRPTVADLLLSGSITNGNSYTYFVEGAVTGEPLAVAENSVKPEIAGQFTPATETLAKVAGWTKESDELIEDFPALHSVIRGRLLTRLAIAEEKQLLNGSGTAPNVRGLLNRVGIQTETQAVAPDTAADAIFRAITKVSTGSFLPADFVVMNPADYQTLRLAKDLNGQYYGGGFFSGAYGQGGVQTMPNVWGVPTVVTTAIAAKTVLVGSSQAAQVFRKGGVRVDIANQNEDDFINNRITTLVEERLLLAVYYPAALVKVTLL
ncbi:MAG TPA: phage major capsid protein [Propionibacteriaceae bacterium]|nr:phage major capsid protein [Propionibacteriaceae bacterium]